MPSDQLYQPINDELVITLLPEEENTQTVKNSADLHTIFGFVAELIAGLGDILYLSRFLSYLDQENIVFAGLSPVGISLGVLIAVCASVGTAKSHFELNKYFESSEKTDTSERKLLNKEKLALLFNMIGYGINFSSPIGSGLRKAKYDFGLTISERTNFIANISLLALGTASGLGDARACEKAMSHTKFDSNNLENKKTDKISVFSAAGRIPGAVSYFYFAFVFFKLWGTVISDNIKNENAENVLTTILPIILSGIFSLAAMIGTTFCRYKLYDYCASGLPSINADQNELAKIKLTLLQKTLLILSFFADTVDIASSLAFNAEILAVYILNAKKNPLTAYQELFGLFIPALLVGAEGAAANYRTIKTTMINKQMLFSNNNGSVSGTVAISPRSRDNSNETVAESFSPRTSTGNVSPSPTEATILINQNNNSGEIDKIAKDGREDNRCVVLSIN